MSPRRLGLLVGLLALLPLAGVAAADLDDATVREATLRSVTFIDPDRGWAAGDFGTILKTEDGGLSWQPLEPGTDDDLEAIAMFNSRRGLAIGGRYDAYSRLGRGTVLWTTDGGASWKPSETPGLPPLRCLIIGSGGVCVAAGDWSASLMSNVFVSSNGGRSWEAAATSSPDPVVCLAGSTDDYLVLSDRGELTRMRPAQMPRQILPPGGGWSRLAADGPHRWLGSGEASLWSSDRGATWQLASTNATHRPPECAWLSQDRLWSIDVASATLRRGAITARPQQRQIASAPLRSLFRLDQDRGWAVGDWGTIAITRDGGNSWRTVRGGERRPAVMAVAADAAMLPWSLLAQESLQYRRRVAIVTAGGDPLVRAAARIVGPAPTYRWQQQRQQAPAPPVRHADGAWADPAASTAGATAETILQGTTPAVLVLDGQLSAETRLRWTELATQQGVQRVLETGVNGGQMLRHSAALTLPGMLAGDAWVDALAILRPATLPPQELRLGSRYDAFSNLAASESPAAFLGNDRRYQRDSLAATSRRHLQVLQARTNEGNWIESMVHSRQPAATVIEQLEASMPRVATENQQRLVMRMIVAAKTAGRPDLYRRLLEVAARLWPDEPLGQIAALYHQRIEHSLEWQRVGELDSWSLAAGQSAGEEDEDAVQLSPFYQVTRGSAVPITPANSAGQPIDWPLQPGPEGGVVQAAAQSEQPQADSVKQPAEAHRPEVRDWNWDHHPAVLVARRATQPEATSEGSPLLHTRPLDHQDRSSWQGSWQGSWIGDWSTLAQQSSERAVLLARLVNHRPTLDGRLDEPLWASGAQFPIGRRDTATLHVAHDADFVYFAVDGPALQPADQRITRGTRDAPLDASDRYVVRIDIDGDLLTALELEFDAAGNTRDTCDGFTLWQPTWYIAVDQRDERMTTEIAIRRSDLAGPLLNPERPWHVSLQRRRPGQQAPILQLPSAGQWRVLRFE